MIIAEAEAVETRIAPSEPLRASASIDSTAFQQIRRSLMLNHCKWDPQVGDVSTLATFPLILTRAAWHELQRDAESLATEALAAEAELLLRPDLGRLLGLPRRIQRAISRASWKPDQIAANQNSPRIVRFDFHWTSDGWQISEANADVPGGYSESSAFAELISPHIADAEPVGNPAQCWANAIARAAYQPGAQMALVAAPGHLEDQQIVAYVAQLLRQHKLNAHICGPRNLRWQEDGLAILQQGNRAIPIDLVVRFFQAEWLAGLPWRQNWQRTFAPVPRTIIANPTTTTLIESKRFPLVWDQLRTSLPTWRRLLPPTADPRKVDWRRDDHWLLKAAYCNTGDSIVCPASADSDWRALPHTRVACRSARWRPRNWAAQRRFETRSIQTPAGRMFPCIGVYTVNGKAVGAYGRLSPGPLIDYRAIDTAVMVKKNSRGCAT